MKLLPVSMRCTMCATIALTALTLPACSSAGRNAKKSAAESAVVSSAGEIEGDPQVEAQLEMLDPRPQMAGKSKVLVFDLHNKSTEKQSFAYAIDWYDRAGKRIGTDRKAWTALTLAGGATLSLRVPMPSQAAESWRLCAVRPDEIR